MRDSERQKTYDAEAYAFEATAFEVPQGLYFLEQTAHKLAHTTWWRTQQLACSFAVVEAHPTARRSTASRSRREIRIAHGMDTVATLCHEMAHLVTTDGHGPHFRAATIELVRLCGGTGAAERLATAYVNAKLAYADVPVAAIPSEDGLASIVLDAPPDPNGESAKHARRIAGLLAKAASTNPEEAEALQAKALELSSRYGITRAHIEAISGDEQAKLCTRKIRLGAGPYVAARGALLHAVATSRCCVLVWTNDRYGRVVDVLGHQLDVIDVETVFAGLDHQARVEVLAATPVGNTLQFRRSWLLGFASAVNTKLVEATRAAILRQDAERAAEGPSTDLVLTERRKAVDAYAKAQHPRVRSVGTRGSRERTGYALGRVAGERAAVGSRPLPAPRRALAASS